MSEPLDLTPTLPPFTVAELAPILNVSLDTVYDSVHRGEIHALRLGRTLRIPRAEAARLLGLTQLVSAGEDQSPAADDDTASGGPHRDGTPHPPI